MKPIKILYVSDGHGIGTPYLNGLLDILSANNQILLTPCPYKRFSPNNTHDILIYHYMKDGPNKDKDQMFLDANLKKILFDSNDSGSRFMYEHLLQKDTYVIKNCPHKDMFKRLNIIFTTTFPFRPLKNPDQHRNIDISFRVKEKNSRWGTLRQDVKSQLEVYASNKGLVGDFKFRKDGYYPDYLRRVKISVNCPGAGEGCIRHLLSLQAKCLVVAHSSIRNIKLLPSADLIDGEDYISFDWCGALPSPGVPLETQDNNKTLNEKLDFVFSNQKRASKIANNGWNKFRIGTDKVTNANHLFRSIQEI